MLVVQDLIKVLTLEKACIIAQGLMSLHHISQIMDCRWNGHTFHASSCSARMDAGSSSTKMRPVNIGEQQTAVKVCAWANLIQTVFYFYLHITSGDGNRIYFVSKVHTVSLKWR